MDRLIRTFLASGIAVTSLGLLAALILAVSSNADASRIAASVSLWVLIATPLSAMMSEAVRRGGMQFARSAGTIAVLCVALAIPFVHHNPPSVRLFSPAEDKFSGMPLKVSYSVAGDLPIPLARVSISIDGRTIFDKKDVPLGRHDDGPFAVPAGGHSLHLEATDSRGARTVIEREVYMWGEK